MYKSFMDFISMMSLFSSFDLNFFKLGTVMLLLIFMMVMGFFWRLSTMKMYYLQSFNFLSTLFYSVKPKSFTKSFYEILFMLFAGLFFMNFFSVYSFNFPLTTQLNVIFFISFSFWTSFIMISVCKNISGFLSHFVPEGSPMILVVFLFLIETVSCVIRPLTLSVRLLANILAGHLLMTLLSHLVELMPAFFIFYVGLNCVELAVSVIQAYIFVTMISLYFSEV